ncbi:TonB-dependent receptor [Sphingomonas sp. SRS2]|uniref:TonB-dependent receptor n=1 Tax=Sphingomonas sp. SRS2 TaxID=133190 RepID=UPI000A0761AC|nr:TonB-dependent receptor [Sphingomonas sp. SRS2]
MAHSQDVAQPGSRRRLLPILLGSACFAVVPSTVHAQAPQDTASPGNASNSAASPPADGATVADIVVTAQRRSERLQDVPIAISALGPASLSQGGAGSIVDLQGSVPGLSITGSAGINATNLVSLRGVAGQAVPIGANQATAIYLDGVYLSKPDAGFFGLQDVERVEVLRGPQGTLYGRNATAGAINIITYTPSDKLEGKFDASYGNYNAASVGGYVSGPLVGDLSASLSGGYNRRDGFFRNTLTGHRIGGNESYSARIKLAYDNHDNFDAMLSADYTHKLSDDLFTPSNLVGRKQSFAKDSVTTDLESQIRTRLTTGGVALTMNVHPATDFTITSISSYRRFNFFTVYDIDGGAAALIHPMFSNKNETFSEEIRGVYAGDRFRFTVGANYFNEKAQVELAINPPAFTKAQLDRNPQPRTTSDLNALAGFGQFEFDLLPKVTIVGGLRFNYEKRDFTIDYSSNGTAKPLVGEVSDTAWLPSAGVNFKLSRDILLYAKVNKGYQSPGYAYLPGAGNPVNTFNPETLWAYEAGIKSQFLDRMITLNLAAFYYDYKDIQLRRTVALGITTVENAGAATVKGGEAELIFRPMAGLTLNAQATYSNAHYTRFCETITAGTPGNGDPLCSVNGLPGADRRGNALNEAPKWSGGVGATYEFALGDNTLKLGANYAWESNSYFSSVNEVQLSNGGWHRLDARASLALRNGLELYAFGRNLTDERHPTNGFRFGGIASIAVSDPRVYGAGATFKF